MKLTNIYVSIILVIIIALFYSLITAIDKFIDKIILKITGWDENNISTLIKMIIINVLLFFFVLIIFGIHPIQILGVQEIVHDIIESNFKCY